MFVNIGSKSFKRRYCYLRQEVDGTYILDLYKDEKKGEAKVTIVMDFCTDVLKVNCFIIQKKTRLILCYFPEHKKRQVLLRIADDRGTQVVRFCGRKRNGIQGLVEQVKFSVTAK